MNAAGDRDEGSAPRFALRLFISGMSPRSTRALASLKKLCDQELAGRYELEVIDIYQQPQLAIDHQIVAVPTLVRHQPAPLRRIIGDLSDAVGLRFGLELARR